MEGKAAGPLLGELSSNPGSSCVLSQWGINLKTERRWMNFKSIIFFSHRLGKKHKKNFFNPVSNASNSTR